MAETNMNTRENPNATEPVMEFSLPSGEVDAELEVGEFGSIIVPVEVISKAKGKYTFRKTSSARTEGGFRKESLPDMKKRIGVVEEFSEKE